MAAVKIHLIGGQSGFKGPGLSAPAAQSGLPTVATESGHFDSCKPLFYADRI